MLVVDASVCVSMLLSGSEAPLVMDNELVAPPLLWSETVSALRELASRGVIAPAVEEAAIGALDRLAVERRAPAQLYTETWRVARELGWAKTYDAEYVALARLLGARLLTRDARLRRGARRLVRAVGPDEVAA